MKINPSLFYLLFPGLSCNSSSFLNGSSGHSSEWDNQNLLFSNISVAINESNSLMEIEKMLRGNTLMENLTLPNINLDEGKAYEFTF